MLKRHITEQIIDSLHSFPAVLLIGARQVGKSTIAKTVLDQGMVKSFITLDNLSQLEASIDDPDGFIAGLPKHCAIDEIQRSPHLLRSIKQIIDKDRKASHFLLTGSANVLNQPEVPESLGGRVDVISLEGLSLAELNQRETATTLITDLLTCQDTVTLHKKLSPRLNVVSPLNKTMLAKHVFYGGFPEVAMRAHHQFAERWFASYQTTYIERDIRNISKNVDAIPFNKALQFCALQTGQLLVMNNMAQALGIDRRTLTRYLGLLALTFQVKQLQPWYANTKKRLTKTAKIYALDSGMACFLNGINHPEDLINHVMFGALAETWLWSELRKLVALSTGIQTYFYRTHTGHEVDFVMVKGRQQCGIELKLSHTVSGKDFKGLKDWQETQPNNSLGIILYTGDEWVSFNSSLAAVPIKILG